jgi:beta-glucosidase/6-phospho-beta-glucosidase/beta-galactosidase
LYPEGLRDTINWVYKEYNQPEIYITENGYSSIGGLNDVDRVEFFNTHLESVLKAIEDGCNVTAFTAWSLMDNFEWNAGYTYGIIIQ